MAKSNKPIIWLPFAAGGMLSAMATPVMILLTGILVPLGIAFPHALDYERIQAFAHSPIGKLAIFVVIFLPLWHAAHRLRIGVHDLGIKADTVVAMACYLVAAGGTLCTIVALFRI